MCIWRGVGGLPPCLLRRHFSQPGRGSSTDARSIGDSGALRERSRVYDPQCEGKNKNKYVSNLNPAATNPQWGAEEASKLACIAAFVILYCLGSSKSFLQQCSSCDLQLFRHSPWARVDLRRHAPGRFRCQTAVGCRLFPPRAAAPYRSPAAPLQSCGPSSATPPHPSLPIHVRAPPRAVPCVSLPDPIAQQRLVDFSAVPAIKKAFLLWSGPR